MIINWGALALVACTTVVAAVVIVGLFSLGVAALTTGQGRSGAAAGHGRTVSGRPHSRPNVPRAAGYACLGAAGSVVLYGLYLIIPTLH
jgi:hypothetical protein